MKHRKLRIAWSVGWGAVAVLLSVLWVRSYWWWDSSTFMPGHLLATMKGEFLWDTPLAAIHKPWTTMPAVPQPRFGVFSQRLDSIIVLSIDERVGVYRGRAMSVPIWWAVVGAIGIAALGWLRLRYSLRTMLVAMTLVAVGLGVWVSQAEH